MDSTKLTGNGVGSDKLMNKLDEKITVLLDASMLFLTHECVDVLILEHSSAECVEVIAYSPFLNLEAPRMYLDLSLVNQKIETVLQHKKDNPNDKKYLEVDEYLTSFITTRLMILGGSNETSKFTIHLIPTCESDIVIDQRHCRF